MSQGLFSGGGCACVGETPARTPRTNRQLIPGTLQSTACYNVMLKDKSSIEGASKSPCSVSIRH